MLFRSEVLQFQFINGYTRRLGINYTVPYINRKQNIGLSAGIFFSRNHEITYDTKNNKLLFFKDQDRFPRNDFSTYVSINKRKGIYQYFFTSVEYRRNITLDTVLSLNPDFFINQSTTQQGLSISWKYRFDKRDYKPYPMRGVYFEFDVFRSGFATMKNEPDLTSFSAGIRKYVKLNEKFNFSGMLKARITQLSKAPFYNQKAIGYGQDYIRGYDYYVINGQNFFLIKSQFKYTLMKNRVYKMGLIKTEKFNKIPIAMYLNAFGDGGYVSDRFYNATNTLTNSFQYSYGVGFDYVTYYDLVFRVEYAINRLNERGFFFRVGAAF